MGSVKERGSFSITDIIMGKKIGEIVWERWVRRGAKGKAW